MASPSPIRLGFVSGRGFSRAARAPKIEGFSPPANAVLRSPNPKADNFSYTFTTTERRIGLNAHSQAGDLESYRKKAEVTHATFTAVFGAAARYFLGGRTELSEPGNQRQSRWPGDRERMFEQLR